MALRSKFVTRYSQKHGLTHFLSIPLVTPPSTSQFRDSFKCLWNELAATDVPIEAIRSLGLLHLNLDTPLSLETPEQIAKATDILRKLSINKTLPTTHEPSTSRNLPKDSSRALPTSNDDANNSMAPPCVSVSGLFCRPGKEAGTFKLGAKVYDATHRVRDWKLRIAHAYQAAGLSPRPRRTRDPQARAALEEILGSYDATVCLVHMPCSTETVPWRKNPAKLVNPFLPPFDARGLLERYKDHVWIENAPLERVSICKMGFQRLGAKELQEVFSIPL